MSELETVVRDVIREALDASPNLLPQDRRYADDAGQRIAKDIVAHEIAHTLMSNGWLPLDLAEVGDVRTLSNHSAVHYTMGQMRTRLLKHIRGGGHDMEAQRQAMTSIALAFFSDLESRGWRLMRTNASSKHFPTSHGAHPREGPKG